MIPTWTIPGVFLAAAALFAIYGAARTLICLAVRKLRRTAPALPCDGEPLEPWERDELDRIQMLYDDDLAASLEQDHDDRGQAS